MFCPCLGRQAEVSLCAGGSHFKAGRDCEEDWKSGGGIEAVLGGPAGGTAGEAKKIKTRTQYYLPKANFTHTASVFSWHSTILSAVCFLLSLWRLLCYQLVICYELDGTVALTLDLSQVVGFIQLGVKDFAERERERERLNAKFSVPFSQRPVLF